MSTVSSEPGVLYVVGTPIGNLEDMTPRAARILSTVDLIAAEDTRHSLSLVRHFGVRVPLMSLHEHNEREVAPTLVRRLAGGASIALISDAGTPLVSDPGYHLVRTARGQGIRVVPVPGASALVCALSASGLPSDRFVFEGFLPARREARRRRIEQLRADPRTLILYEAPHRLPETLGDLAAIFGEQRPAVLAKELTKLFETIHDDTLGGLCRWLAADERRRRGEFVLLIHGADLMEEQADREGERVLGILLEALPVKRAAELAARITGQKRNRLYRTALEWSQASGDAP